MNWIRLPSASQKRLSMLYNRFIPSFRLFDDDICIVWCIDVWRCSRDNVLNMCCSFTVFELTAQTRAICSLDYQLWRGQDSIVRASQFQVNINAIWIKIIWTRYGALQVLRYACNVRYAPCLPEVSPFSNDMCSTGLLYQQFLSEDYIDKL